MQRGTRRQTAGPLPRNLHRVLPSDNDSSRFRRRNLVAIEDCRAKRNFLSFSPDTVRGELKIGGRLGMLLGIGSILLAEPVLAPSYFQGPFHSGADHEQRKRAVFGKSTRLKRQRKSAAFQIGAAPGLDCDPGVGRSHGNGGVGPAGIHQKSGKPRRGHQDHLRSRGTSHPGGLRNGDQKRVRRQIRRRETWCGDHCLQMAQSFPPLRNVFHARGGRRATPRYLFDERRTRRSDRPSQTRRYG